VRTLKTEKRDVNSPKGRASGRRSPSFFAKATWPATLLGAGVVCIALGYGLIAGGHFSNIGNEISKGARGAVQVAGLSIREITISGNKRASRESILGAAGFDVGTPIMSFKAIEARDRLQELDWIETARVVRLLPDRVSIEVSERQPFALWQLNGHISVIDRTGKPLTSLSPSDYPGFVQLVGKNAGKKGAELIASLREFPLLNKQVKFAVRVADRRWTLKLVQNIDVYLPEDNIATALQEFVRLEERYQLLSKKINIIDMRLPEKITIRLRDVVQKEGKATIKKVSGEQAL